MPELLGPARPKVAGAFKVVDVVDLGGLFIKSVTAAGLITYQDANDTEQTIQISISGFDLHGGSAAPAASLGASGDWYLRFSNGQWLEKVNTTWHGRYTPPQLSDAAPLATSTSADEGTGLASSREDHIHIGLALGSQQPEDTDNAADTGARGFASREDHVHAVGFGTGNVESVGDANAAGTNPHPARRDHVHDGGSAGGGPDLSDTIPPSIGEDGAAGTDDDASRADHTHGGQRAVSNNLPEDVGTAASGSHAAASRSDHVHGGGGASSLSDDNPENVDGAADPGTGAEASRDDHVHRNTFSTTTPSAVAVVGAVGGENLPARADHAHSGAFLSDADPQDVAADGEEGDNSGAARSDHVHGLPIDNTLQFDGSDQLGVNIGDVVEHLQQNVRYYTSDSLDHSTGGSAAGQVYTTSRYPKNISRIKAEVRPDTPSVYKAGIYTVDDDNEIIASLGQSGDTDEIPSGSSHTLTFNLLDDTDDSLGIPLSGNERIAVLIRRAGAGNNADTRLRRGGEAANSPNESYPDAELDFVLVNHVVYEHEDPVNGNNTESHGTSIRGNLRIFYTVTIDHGSLVGDGIVNAAHINSESAADGYVLTADGSGGSAWEASTGGGGGGSGYGDWASIGSVTGAISGNPVTVALNTNETIDDYEELYIHIEANDTNDQRVVSGRFRVSDVPTTTLAGGGLGIPFAGNNTDEGAILVRRNTDGDAIVLDAFGSVINFPATAVTSIYARELTAGGGGGGASLSDADPEDVGTTAPGTDTEASRSDHVHAGDIDLADAAPQDIGTAASGTSEDASRADHIHGGGGAGSLSADDPEDVGEAADDGADTNASKSDHVHRLPVQNTLQFNSAGAVGVSIADVVEHLQQNIRYYTSDDDYSTDGSAAGHVYTTSRFPKNISRVTAHLTPPSGISDAIYKAGVYTVTNGNQIIAVLGQSADSPEISAEGTYSFDLRAEGSDTELGISLAGDERIAILVRRIGAGNEADTGLRHGSAAANSPNVSYPDAEIDFDDVNHVIYRHENPAAGNDTHSHGTDIRGNLRIFYTVTIDHGSLVGDGNVNAGHIDSESATDGWVLTADGAGGSAFEVAAGGTELTEAQVTDDTDTTFGAVSGERIGQAAAAYGFDGSYNNARAYRIGQSIRANSHLWMAPTAIVAGVGEPSLVSPHGWSLISRADQYLGHLIASNSYDMLQGNWYRVGHRVFFVIADVNGITGTALTGGDADIVELTSHHLTEAQATDETSTVFGQVSGERLSAAVAEFESPAAGHSPRITSGIAFPTNPPPVASDQFYFQADVPSGLDWFDTDTTTALTAAEKGDLALHDGTQWNRTLNLLPANLGGFRRINLYTETQRVAEVPDGTFLRIQMNRAPAADSKVEIDIVSLSASIVGEFPAAEFEADHFLLNEIVPVTQTNTDHMIDETMGRPAPTAGNITKSYTTLFIGRGNAAGDELVLVCPEWTAFGLMTIAVREIKPAGSGSASDSPNFFSAHAEAGVSAALSTTPANRISIVDADILINRGDFTVVSGTNSLNAIQVAETGTYLVEFNIHIVDDAGPTTGRAQIQGDIVVISAGVMQTDFTARTSMYWRGQNDTDEIYISGTHTVDLLADDQIEIHFSTGDTETISWIVGGGESEVSIVRLAGGGGASDQTAGQVSGGLTEQVIIGSRLATTEYGLGTLWTAVVDAISPTINPPIDPDNLLQIAVGLRIDTEAAPEIIISGASIRRITHTNDPLPSTAVSSDEIPGAYYSARVPQNNEDRVIEINPTLSWMEKRRQAGRYGLLFAFTDNAAGDLTSIRPFVSSATEIDIEYIVAIIGAS